MLVIGMCLTVVVLIARLVLVQVLDGSRYAAYAAGEVNQRVTLPATRGAIYDRAGDLLAVSVPRFDVVADDFQIAGPQSEAAQLAPLLHVDEVKLVQELSERNGYVVLAKEISSKTQSAIAALTPSGISYQNDSQREWPGGALFQPLLGGVNAAGVGDASLEYQMNAKLSGHSGSEVVAEAPGGVELPSGATDVTAPVQGASLVLTIDEPLQVEATKDVEAQMKATHSDSGQAVVMDVHTGAILAMVDLVTGPKGVIGPAPQNLVLTSVYQPGSVMKLATISYAVQDHLISPSTVFTVPYQLSVGGYTFQDADLHGTEQLPVSQILAQSSNIGTIKISQILDLQRLAQALKAYGFGQYTGLNWPGESPGIVGTPATWIGSSAAASVPIGTGEAVTPMQVLDAYNSVANGGVELTPRLVQATIDANGVEHPTPAGPSHRTLLPSTVAEVIPMLSGVVQDETGTAIEAQIPGYCVAGKTGTAQVPDSNGLGYVPGDWNATFVGFVPAQAPQLSGIVVLNHPDTIYGGVVSAPVFRDIMSYALRHFGIAPPGSGTASPQPCDVGAK